MLEFLERNVEERRAATDAGVVDKQIDTAVHFDDGAEHRRDRDGVGDVDRHRVGAPTESPDGFGRLPGTRGVDVGDDDGSAFAGQRRGHSETDAAGGTRYERNLVPQAHFRFLPVCGDRFALTC